MSTAEQEQSQPHLPTLDWDLAIGGMNDPVVLLDANEQVIKGNDAFYRYIRTAPDDAIGIHVAKLFHPEGEITSCPICKARSEQRDALIVVETEDPHNHMGEPFEAQVTVLRDEVQSVIGFVQVIRGISQVKEQLILSKKQEERFKTLLDSAPDPLIIVDQEGRIIISNQLAEEKFGYSKEELQTHKVEVLLPEVKRDKHVKLRKQYAGKATPRAMGSGIEVIAKAKNGDIYDVEISLNPIELDSQQYVSASIRDISKRKATQKELHRLATFPELNPMPVIEVDLSGELIYCNEAARKAFPKLEHLGSDHPALEEVRILLNSIAESSGKVTNVIVFNDTVFEQQITYMADYNVVRVYSWDITEIRDLANEMSYQASHDSLTGLINRKEFDTRVNEAIHEAAQDKKQHALCYLDLDQFKAINDHCGHMAGDDLLTKVSELLKENTRESDTVARLGGDEFGVLLKGCSLGVAKRVAEGLRKAVADFRFNWEGRPLSVGVSIGVVPITEESVSLKEVLSAADTACYVAKESGRNKVHIYFHDDEESSKHARNIEWIHRINEAIEKDDFVLYKQKIKSVNDSELIYHELLIRMKAENGELILPGIFLPVAERFNLMKKVDQWVIHKACCLIRDGKLKTDICAINLSGDTLSDILMVDFILEEFDKTGVDPTMICFEITETVMVYNFNCAQRFISILKGVGCRFALDDFGSGVSSFHYLKNLVIDQIKIDGALVRDIMNSDVDEAMVRSIHEIANTMGVTTVAEFVEDENTFDRIKSLGVEYAQGYEIERPRRIEEE